MKGWLGITLGDPGGIGPEVTFKALARIQKENSDPFKYLVCGDARILQEMNAFVPAGLPLAEFKSPDQPGRFFFIHSGPALPRDFIQGSPITAESAMAALTESARRAIAGELDGIVTAPVNKENIIKLGRPFMGQTEYLSELAGTERTAMVLLGADDRGRWLRVALVTTHIPLREVADKITGPKIIQTIELAAQACRDLGLPRARIGVCGLNPHSGEGGKIGTEEITTITPAIEEAKTRGIDVTGPVPADTLFYYAYNGHYDAVVAMYHDQGLAPLKMIGFESGINWTVGLPFIRTSPDHGTGYDIAGKNKANPESMLAAINLARQLARQRP